MTIRTNVNDHESFGGYQRYRRQGIQGSNTDFLICAVSERYDMPILTTDDDFKLFQKHLPIKLHEPRFNEK